MGVDFNQGSMSYKRYDNLIVGIAKYFNGIPNIEIPLDLNESIYCFGYIDSGSNEKIKEKFTFNPDIPDSIIKLCNDPYGDLSEKDIKNLYDILKEIKQNIIVEDEVSSYTIEQFVRELENCIINKVSWYVS